MKKNTQKILLSLYSDEKSSVSQLNKRIPIKNLKLVVPNLSDGGFRSLLHFLKQQGSISSQRSLGETTVSITQHGVRLIEAEFPALLEKWDAWQGNWECLIFTQAPVFDKQFRYLRKLLIQEGAINVSRGVYMCPGGFSDLVLSECHTSYYNSLIIFSVGKWKIAKESSFIIEKYGLLDLVEAYSGISKDVSRVIKSMGDEKTLMSGLKNEISLVYDRLLNVLAEDPGFCMFYFPEVPKVKEILNKLNSLITR